MLKVIISSLKLALLAIVMGGVLSVIITELSSIGKNPLQSFAVTSFYIYCILTLTFQRRFVLFHALSIPVLTQFMHLAMRYDYDLGINSFSRLFPFIVIALSLLIYIVEYNVKIKVKYQIFLMFWVGINTVFIILSPVIDKNLFGNLFFYNLLMPLYFIFFADQSERHNDFRELVSQYLYIIFFILGLGTIGLVYSGAQYIDSDSLLATRNISDTNVTIAYFILLWPFANYYSVKKSITLLKILPFVLILTITIISFSRGSLLIVIPLCLISYFIIFFKKKHITTSLLSIPVVLLTIYFVSAVNLQSTDLWHFWMQRFDFSTSSNEILEFKYLEKLFVSSGRDELHQIAINQFNNSPIIGNGYSSYEFLGPGFREAHSLFYTQLAETGIVGLVYFYCLLGGLLIYIYRAIKFHPWVFIFFISFLFFLLFNHTVGSVLFLTSYKSMTINLISPMLIVSTYFFIKSDSI